MKFLAITLLISGSIGMGAFKTMELYRRVRFLRDLQDMIQRLGTEILYELTDLATMMERLSLTGQGTLREFSGTVSQRCRENRWDSFSQLWEKSSRELFGTDSRLKEERDVWIRLGRQLGHGDADRQKQILNQCGEELKRLESEARTDLKTRGRMYISLGVCAGLFFTVIFL